MVVFPSQSYLYESLCLVKDLKWLNQNKTSLPEHLRLNRLPRIAGHLPSGSNESLVVREVWKQSLPRLYELESLSTTMLEAVLTDEYTVSLRDLPSFLACGNSLLYKLRSGLGAITEGGNK